jgi:hypothetical protein
LLRKGATGSYLISPAGSGPAAAGTSAPATESATACGHWTVSRGAVPGSLTSVVTLSRYDAWAAGNSEGDTLVLHWNGRAWRAVISAEVAGFGAGATYTGISATSYRDVWAVDSTDRQTLIEHWNGKRFRLVASPDPGGPSQDNYLYGVAATSPRSAWAVGLYTSAGGSKTLILHWNGSAWTQVPSPDPSSAFSELDAVAAVSASDAWAVGEYFDGTVDSEKTLIVHWNGSAWTQVPSPYAGRAQQNQLTGVSATTVRNAWAVGIRVSADATIGEQITEHWDGRSWKLKPNRGAGILTGVAAIADRNAWAVGFKGSPARTLVERWRGVAWRFVPSPNPAGSPGHNVLNAISASSATNVWAVGEATKKSAFGSVRTVALHYC